MDKASKVDLNTVVKKLVESELGFLLLEADEKSFFDILAEQTSFNDRQGMYCDYHVTYHLYPLMYNNKDIQITQDLISSRANAIHNVFVRWDESGYNRRHAKQPYNCKAFIKYLDEIKFMKADYMLLLVD